jgi:hypothetical protein
VSEESLIQEPFALENNAFGAGNRKKKKKKMKKSLAGFLSLYMGL